MEKQTHKQFLCSSPSEPIKLFCLDCNSAICCVCQGENHDGHKCSSVDKVGEEFRSQLRDFTGKISDCLESIESELLGKLDKTSQGILNQTEKLKTDVLEKAEKIKEMVDRHAQELMQEIELVKIKKQKEVETEKEEISRHMTMLESYERYVNEMIVKGSTVDICGTFHDMKIKAGELQKNHLDVIESVSDHGNSEFISLDPSELENILKDDVNMVGIINPVNC